jgi:4-coumarate--CoA ligase
VFDSDGFVKTGDVGYFDEKGMLFVIDRKKEILKYKGYQVNPSEIENLIQSIEGVEQVSVVGIPDDFVNSLLTAAVVKRKGFEKLNEKTILQFIANTLPDYKHLHGGVHFFDNLPMTPSGKVQKRHVLENILRISNKSFYN